MDGKRKENARADQTSLARSTKPPRSLAIAARGIKIGQDYAKLMSALMCDLIEGRVTPNVGNATCNAGGKLLKVIEMEYKYGTKGEGGSGKTLRLVDDPE
jgi:hypothetical protein